MFVALTEQQRKNRYQGIAGANLDASIPHGAPHNGVDTTGLGKQGGKDRPEAYRNEPNGRGTGNVQAVGRGVAPVKRHGNDGASCDECKFKQTTRNDESTIAPAATSPAIFC